MQALEMSATAAGSQLNINVVGGYYYLRPRRTGSGALQARLAGGISNLATQEAASKYKLLAKSGVLRMLVALYEHGPMPVHKLSKYGIGSGTAYRAAREATLMGLTRLYECGASTCVDLTERGRRAAQYLMKALEVLVEGLQQP